MPMILFHPAFGSTGNSAFPAFPNVTLGQDNNTCIVHTVNSMTFLFKQPRFEQVKFNDENCLGVNNSAALNGGLYAVINSSSAGNLGYTQGTTFSIANPNIWSGCCSSGDKIFLDINLHGRIAFTGGADSLIRLIVKRQGTICNYYDTNCHMWEWVAWNLYGNAPPPNVERAFMFGGVTSGDALLDVGGNINGYYTRFYLDAGIFGNSGPIEIQIDAQSNSSADQSGAAADFATPGFYVAILDYGWIHRSLPAAPSIAAGLGTPNGAYTNGPSVCWNRVSDIEIITSYSVQIATDSGFGHVVASRSVPEIGAGAYCYSPSLSDGQYYWRVQDSDNIGQTSLWSSTYTFYVDKTPPTSPVLSSPANNALLAARQPTLNWNPSTDPSLPNGIASSGVAGYGIEVSSSSSFGSFYYNTASGTSILAPSGLTDGAWYWRVEAVDNVGNVGSWSSAWSFTVDTTPASTSTLVSPANGVTTGSNTPTLSWSSASDLNGVRSYNVELDTSSLFNSANRIVRAGIAGTQFTVSALSANTWYWHVQAVDNAGNTGSWSATWSFTAPPPPDFSMSLSSTSTLWVAQGSSNAITLNLQSYYGFGGSVSFSTSPATNSYGIVLNNNPNPITLNANGNAASTITVTASNNTPAGSYLFSIYGTSGGITHKVDVYFNVISSPINIDQTTTFFGITARITGSFTVNSLAHTLAGTAYITAINSTSGVTIANAKPYQMTLSWNDNNMQSIFLDELAASPYWLGLGCTITITTGSTSCTFGRTPDINHDGIINVIDLATVSYSWNSKIGDPKYDPNADLDANGAINILDLATVAYYNAKPTFLP